MGKELILFSFKLLARNHSLNALERMRDVIIHLEERIPLHESPRITDAFSLLIATILSQNINDRNSSRAFHNLMQRYEIKPAVFVNLKPEEIKPLIKSVGLQEIRSRRIIALSKTVLHKFNGDLNQVIKLPLLKARQTLLSLDGVGPKTADVLLNFLGGRAIMPIDTKLSCYQPAKFCKGENL